MTDATRAALLMTFCMAAFSSNDALMKALSASMPLGQALFLRGAGSTLLVGLWAAQRGVLLLRLDGRAKRLIAARAAAETATGFFFLTAVFNMPLANATAILQASPLVVSVAAAMIFGEALGRRQLAAIALGLFGVLVMLRPGSEGFNIFALSALAAVVSLTARDLITRAFPAHLPSLTAAVWSALAVTVFGGVMGLSEIWVWPGLIEWLLVAGSCVTILAAYLLSVAAMRTGGAVASAPFRYSALLWALLLGFFVFGDWPDPITLLGAGLVVVSGLYALRITRLNREPGR
ncbi:MAG: DMT family transporter [Rhodobacteraceae bacterium]|nr:DMT family transporter [Paracoccaceae bacterium]